MGIDTNDDDLHGFPAAPKGNSGPEGPYQPNDVPPSEPFTAGGAAWESGSLFPPSSPFSGADPLFPLTGPYAGSGEASSNPIFRPDLDRLEPPPPVFPSRTDFGARERPPSRNTALLAIGAVLAVLLVAGGVGYLFISGGKGSPLGIGTNSGPTATIGPTATPTLLPNQTPLPSPIPTATLPPGANYAGSAVISFKRVTQGVASPASVGVSTSASDSRLKVVSASDTATDTSNPTGDQQPGTPVKVTLTVTNPSNNPKGAVQNKAGDVIPGSNGESCKLVSAQGYALGESRPQECDEPEQFNNPTSYNFTDSNGLQYVNPNVGAGGSPPYYTVPQNCGSAATISSAESSAKSALLNKLNGEMGGSSTYTSLPDLKYSVSCSPGAGTVIPNFASTYTLTITATGSQAGYFPSSVAAYQLALVKAGAGWQMLGTSGCSPKVQSGATLTSATVACKATGTEAWNAFDLAGMARLIQGQSQTTAKGLLNKVQGVVSNSESFSLSGGTFLPTSPSNITFSYSP
jgi:hypothetical protein